jgi:adenine-specific DNA-methyltransferase
MNPMSEDIFETPSSTPNFQTELAERLADLVPEAVADGKIDVLKLQELLAQDAADTSERFGLFWPGKHRALRVAQMPTTATLRPDIEKSKDWEATKNVFIEGDNLEVLKILQKHYHGKIKMIYIDPPYNTGKDFVYPDNFSDGLGNYLEWTRQVNEEGKKVSTNSETEGRYHSNWLTMMYPRLKLARNLLSTDGLILISIDDHEIDNLLRLCKEVFGEGNLIGTFIWKKKGTSTNVAGAQMSALTEYIVAVARDSSKQPLNSRVVSSSERDYPLSDETGKYRTTIIEKKSTGDYDRASMKFAILGQPPREGKRWQLGLEKARELENMGRFIIENGIVKLKIYEHEDGDSYSANPNLLLEYGSTQSGQSEVNALLGGHFFDTPKPSTLIKHLVDLGTKSDSIVLDFFAGSATTAHAVMLANLEDGGTRRYIQIQLPEPIPEESEAGRAGFGTIADISRTRILRASDLIEKKNAEKLGTEGQFFDLGFRSYHLADTAFAKWKKSNDIDPSSLEQHFFDLRDNANDLATQDDLLTEVLIKQGFALTESIEKISIANTEFRSIGGGLVIAYVNEHVKPTLEALRLALDRNPLKFVVVEDALQGDDELKTNIAQVCKSKNIELWTA